jgi:hypothetical protein
MKTKLCTISSMILLMLSSPASALWINHGDGTYSYFPDGAILFVVALGIVGFVVFLWSISSTPPLPERTADEYNAEAVLLSARRHHTEMLTELRKAEIEAARVEAVHKERDEIIRHDKKVRDLNAHLDEKRRSS